MGIHANAGTKVSVGSTASFATATEYAGDTYTLVGGITDAGEAGSEAEVLTSKHIDKPDGTRKLKGTRDAGTMTLVVDRDSSDPGYMALIAAEKTPHAYNFKIELNDKPATGASPKNSIFYLSAIVASAKNAFGEADSIVSTTFTLAISGPILEVPASAT